MRQQEYQTVFNFIGLNMNIFKFIFIAVFTTLSVFEAGAGDTGCCFRVQLEGQEFLVEAQFPSQGDVKTVAVATP